MDQFRHIAINPPQRPIAKMGATIFLLFSKETPFHRNIYDIDFSNKRTDNPTQRRTSAYQLNSGI
jgi:hypothetical protein